MNREKLARKGLDRERSWKEKNRKHEVIGKQRRDERG